MRRILEINRLEQVTKELVERALVTRKRLIISISMADGGAIEIQSNEPTDAATQEAIRQHLAMIAVRFSQGDFAIPMFIHATVPPGVETMKRLKGKITYEAEDTQRGAELRITTHDSEAHCFYPQLS